MSVLIRGMEMPTEEEIGKCIIIRHDGEVWIVEFDNLIDGGFVRCYPTNPMRAVPVPPHGRLIDVGVLENNATTYYAIPALANAMDFEPDLVLCLREIDNAPTVIEAEEGE